MYKGIAGSDGFGIGRVIKVVEPDLHYDAARTIEPETEKSRFAAAMEECIARTQAMADDMKKRLGESEAEILEGHVMLLMDPELNSQIEAKIEAGTCAEAATEEVCEFFAMMFDSMEDELFAQRATDVRDIKLRLIKCLLGVKDVNLAFVPEGTVIVAKDLTPSMTAGIDPAHVVGILTEVGGRTSHSAILARALEIPAVLSVKGICDMVSDGDLVILDGENGQVFPGPDEEMLSLYTAKREQYLAEKAALAKYRGIPTATADGHIVELCANIGKPEDAQKVMENDGEGVGLFRTEFLYMDRPAIPTEEEQYEAYVKASRILGGRPLIIRTLDVGGDKEIPYMGLEKEENPFLGYRAVRLCLNREDIYKPQLRALLRAGAEGDIRIMIPMIATLEEYRAVKALLEVCKNELASEGKSFNPDIPLGIMVETPAAALMADVFAKEVAFFSIGTNDLTQYTQAADRGNADVAYLYDTCYPAVLRSIRNIITAGSEAGIMVGMCGEAAADPLLIPLLLSFGLKEFSVASSSILATRKAISLWTMDEADAVTAHAMTLTTAAEVKDYLESVCRK